MWCFCSFVPVVRYDMITYYVDREMGLLLLLRLELGKVLVFLRFAERTNGDPSTAGLPHYLIWEMPQARNDVTSA